MVRYSLTKSSSPQPAGLGPVPPVRSAVAFAFEIKFTINVLCLNYPKIIPHSKSVEQLSSTKPVHGAKKVGDSSVLAAHNPSFPNSVQFSRSVVSDSLRPHGLQCGSLEPSCCSVIKSCPTLCDSIDCSSSGLSVLHCLLEFSQTHVHCVSDAFQPSSPLLPTPLLPSIFLS